MNLSAAEQIEQLTEENRQLRGVLGAGMKWPAEWRLSRTETLILGVLVSRETTVSLDSLMTILYSDRIDPPEPNTIRTLITKLRRRIAPFGATIRNIHFTGYYLTAEDRSMLRERAIKSTAVGV